MIPVQPTFFWQYWSGKKTRLTPGVSRKAFLSWEDALWNLLVEKNVPPKSIVLVPEFYCPDVLHNIVSHGYRYKTYPVNKDLRTNLLDFKKAIKQYKPAVVVIFHAVGIHNTLPLPEKGIVIEDSVHSVIDPSRIVIKRSSHFVIDSLRKVVPLQGSVLYGKEEDLVGWRKPDHAIWYASNVYFWWILMQIFLILGFIKQAEYAMIKGYDVIGDHPQGAPALPGTIWLQERLDFKGMRKIKQRQVLEYEKYFPHNLYKPSDREELRGFPLIIDEKKILAIRKRGLFIRKELAGCPWSKKYTIVYLPLGPHISKKQQKEIIQMVRETNGA